MGKKWRKKNRIAVLPISINVGIPARHICTVRTIDSFDTGESQRSKCPRVKDRPWESPPCCVCRESLALCKQTPATKWKPCFTVHYLFSHGSRLRQVELPFLSHREMRNFDRRLLISALPSLVRLRRNWTNQLRQKLINSIHFEMNVLPEALLVFQNIKLIIYLWVKGKIWPVELVFIFMNFCVVQLKLWHSRYKKISSI